MWWNKDNFQGLDAIAALAEARPNLASFVEYCRRREQGLRKEAFGALSSFLAESKVWTFTERKDFVDWLLSTQYAYSRVHQLIPKPLWTGLVTPTLEEWAAIGPTDAVPRRWLGIFQHSPTRLEEALALDPADQIARTALIEQLLGDVDYATHHLGDGNGFFIGSEVDAKTAVDRARELICMLSQSAERSKAEQLAREADELLRDWNEFQSSGKPSFRDWCLANARQHTFWSIAYYRST